MWEAIQSNIRRSRAIVAVMAVLLVGLGALIGAAWVGGGEGAAAGAVGASMLWLILWIVSMSGGDRLILMSARARRIKKEDAPVLWNVVEEMTIAAGLGTMPSIHVIDNDLPNAFATGRKPETSAVAVTTGLLRKLNRDELQGVIAHEIAHIKNYDIRFLTTATVMIGAIVILADVFVRSLWFGGGRRRSSGRGEGQAIFMILALVMAILAPLFANLLYYAVSRKREYLADASAARYTRYPQGTRVRPAQDFGVGPWPGKEGQGINRARAGADVHRQPIATVRRRRKSAVHASADRKTDRGPRGHGRRRGLAGLRERVQEDQRRELPARHGHRFGGVGRDPRAQRRGQG